MNAAHFDTVPTLPLAVDDEPVVAKPKRRAPRVAAALVAVVALGSGGTWALHRGVESTDDARVEGHVGPVAPRVTGVIARVRVAENQRVEEGEVLVEIDDADVRARVESSRAELAAAEASLASSKTQLALLEKNLDSSLSAARAGVVQARGGLAASRAAIAQAEAEVAAARARSRLAHLDLGRVESLASEGSSPEAQLDAQKNAAEQADAALAQAEAHRRAAVGTLVGSYGGFDVARARLAQADTTAEQIALARSAIALAEAKQRQASAALSAAELQLAYTKVRAPFAGIVQKKSAEVGQVVGPDRPLLALVATDDVWVEADFKEDEIAQMRPGQRAEVKLDTYGRRAFGGHVEAIGAATGSRFSLLPADNASGNFVKVTQRVAVLVRFDGRPDVEMRPGTSAAVTVFTR
jgi:membrane fusion protein (multidrug efflux system)